jgi:dCTP deaminase
MILGKAGIRNLIQNSVIQDAKEEFLSSASLDFRLGSRLYTRQSGLIDCKRVDDILWATLDMPETGQILLPGQVYLGSTVESLALPTDIAASAEGKSTLGRLGVSVHVTAGWIDPGFRGTVTLEISVAYLTKLYPGMRIGQFIFFHVDPSSVDREPYSGRYQGIQCGYPVKPMGGGLF